MYTFSSYFHFHLLTHKRLLSVHWYVQVTWKKKATKQVITIECHIFCALLCKGWGENADSLSRKTGLCVEEIVRKLRFEGKEETVNKIKVGKNICVTT